MFKVTVINFWKQWYSFRVRTSEPQSERLNISVLRYDICGRLSNYRELQLVDSYLGYHAWRNYNSRRLPKRFKKSKRKMLLISLPEVFGVNHSLHRSIDQLSN